jgi:hypothetical protein
MMYKAKVAVCSEVRTKHSTQSERHVEFVNFKPCGKERKLLGFKRLTTIKRATVLSFPFCSFLCVLVRCESFVYQHTGTGKKQ